MSGISINVLNTRLRHLAVSFLNSYSRLNETITAKLYMRADSWNPSQTAVSQMSSSITCRVGGIHLHQQFRRCRRSRVDIIGWWHDVLGGTN